MAPLLPTELLHNLRQTTPYRGAQINQLATFYNNHFPSPPLLVAHGLEDTGKLKCISSVLEARGLSYALIKCADCLSQRHLLSKIFTACVVALGEGEQAESYGKIDTLNSLAVNLQKLIDKREEQLILVLDGIDSQRGGSATLLSALARLPDLIPNLSLILTTSSSRSLQLHKSGLSHIHFPPYTRNEALALVISSPPALCPQSIPEHWPTIDMTLLAQLFAQFASTVYDSLIAPTSSTSLSVLRSTCEKLWPRFIWPYLSGEYPPGKAKTWDYTRLFLRSRALFQIDGESALVDHLRPTETPWTFEELQSQHAADQAIASTTPKIDSPVGLLKPFPSLLLTACWLASHTSQKVDILLFSRLSSTSKSRRIRKNYHKRKQLKSTSADYITPGERGAFKASKKLFDAKSGVGRQFGLERVMAVLRAIHPDGVGRRSKGIADAVYRGMAELERLRLVANVGAGTGVAGDEEERWRINVGREWVDKMGETAGLGVRISEYEVQAD